MYDQQPPSDPLPTTAARQFSLQELFFVTTLCCVALGIHTYFSPLLAMLMGVSVVVVAVVRFCSPHNVLMGGLTGFAAARLMSVLVLGLLPSDTATTVSVALLCPAAGYIVGGAVAESHDDSI